ncbi:hypothetical protein ScPMuIL_000134 [Solemya velum]
MSLEANTMASESGEGDSTKVFVRVRPPDSTEGDLSQCRCLSVDDSARAVVIHSKPEPKIFTFDKVADTHTTQESVFSSVGRKLIESCVAGYNGTIFAYGQTGSGKTFTMLGPAEDSQNFQHEMRGVIPRSFEHLFNLIGREHDLHGDRVEFLCRCSFLEIYHEQVYDLLDPSTSGLHLRENMKKGVYVDGIVEQSVTNASEAYQVLNSGWINRRVAATSMNRESSRSHAVFTLVIESKETKEGVQNVRTSQLNLVDLAGSERQKDTNAVGQRLKEAGSINKSLSILGNVIMSLVDIAHGKSRHVPYRDSKLTFLLRDSLGGNAKTHIIACVHPGSRCFGETLSTLQFARRAKMIKNKAVVNEDTQGNVLQLQMEIRKLKEMLQQYQMGDVPKQLSLPPMSDDQCGSGEGSNQDSEWKEKFMQAMIFREKTELEKNNIMDKVGKLEQLCNKKEKFLQSTKMIIKFRENHISTLEKAVKGIGVPSDIQDMVNTYKSEISVLREQIDHHPLVTKYAMDIQHLKNDLKQLRAQERIHQNIMYDKKKQEQLEKDYRELLAEKSDDSEKSYVPAGTPQSGVGPSTATVEKYKSQIGNLQTEVEDLKKALSEQKEAAEKKELDLQSEVSSCKNTVSELEKVLEAHQLKSRIERETLNDIHLQTVKTITTPKKAAYNLRTRTIMALASQNNTPVLDTSIEEEMGGILDETQPDIIAEQAQQAMMDEIKVLQDTNSKQVERIEEYEADLIRSRQQISKLEHQNEQLNEILTKERSIWASKDMEMTSTIEKLSKDLEEESKSSEMHKEEASDLRVLLQSADREIKDNKTKTKNDSENKNKEIGTLETKVMQFDIQLANITKQADELNEEKQLLQESLENAQETVLFTESMIKELEEKLVDERTRKQNLQHELEITMKDLFSERERNSKVLFFPLRCKTEGKEQEKTLLGVVSEKEVLERHSEVLKVRLDEQTQMIANLHKDINDTKNTVTTQEKKLADNKEVITYLMTKVQTLKTSLASVTSDCEDKTQMCESLQATCQEQTNKLNEAQDQMSQLDVKLEKQFHSHEVEISMMKDELESLTEAYDRLQNEFITTQKHLESAQLRKLSLQLEKKQEEFKNIKDDLEQKVKQAEAKIIPKESENEELSKLLDSQAAEINKYPLFSNRISLNYLNKKLEEYESFRIQKNAEIQNLKSQLTAAEVSQVELLSLQKSYKTLEFTLENEKSCFETRLNEATQCIESYKTDVSQAQAAEQQANKTCLEIEAKQAHLEEKLKILTESLTSKDNKFAQLERDKERLTEALFKGFEENEKMQVEIEDLKELKGKLSMELQEKEQRVLELVDENARLVGHQNPKQKIQYHVQLKEENNYLREQITKLHAEMARFKSGSLKCPGSSQKENLQPGIDRTNITKTPQGQRAYSNFSTPTNR